MKDINKFFSNNCYVYLPTKKSPRVILAVDNGCKNNSLKLYNPFSFKAKIFKEIFKIFSFYKCEYKNKGEFIKFLEEKFDKKLISSLYISTQKEKYVLQLQDNGKIFGYVKFPINKLGIKRVKNEIKAYKLLNRLDEIIAIDEFENKPFIVLKPLNGKSRIFSKNEVEQILKEFERNEKFYLAEHPRIVDIEKKIDDSLLKEILKNIIEDKSQKYKLVYEHGDFAPWNIIEIKNGMLKAFDFEYFVEEGIECFDLIKYYFQIGRLLKKLSGRELFDYVYKNTNCEKKIIFLFLIKEITEKNFEKEEFLKIYKEKK